jgi:hypothetical protein
MGMGYGSCYADCVKQGFVKRTCPKEFKAFIKAIDDDKDVDFDFVANRLNFEPTDEVPEPVLTVYGKLIEAFKKATGLDLRLSFHNSEDEGDRYDDINGAYWWVNGVYQLTPAGEKYKKHITRSNFVIFG